MLSTGWALELLLYKRRWAGVEALRSWLAVSAVPHRNWDPLPIHLYQDSMQTLQHKERLSVFNEKPRSISVEVDAYLGLLEAVAGGAGLG